MSQQTTSALITALLDPAAYNHPCRDIQLIETHISWLLLTGDYAYKIKKPVNFGFLNFSTLTLRKHFCAEEIRLNTRLAPQIYLQVVTITEGPDGVRINGRGAIREYAVKMRQFDNAGLFNRLIHRNRLSREIITDTARRLAHFHGEIAVADEGSLFGGPAAVHHPVQENFTQLEQQATDFLSNREHRRRFEHIHQWSEQTFAALETTFAKRKIDGFVRECHGDLHLGNIVLIDAQVTPFDGIEFNPDLRWIDIMSEMAFLLMDLQDHGRSDLSHRLLDAWLEISGDYGGLAVLRYYQCYRAMVRAKVAALRGSQARSENTESDLANYMQLSQKYTRPTRPALLITHGLSGSGKSWLTQSLLEATGMIRLRSDVERKRLVGLDPLAHSDSAAGTRLYSAGFTQRTFTRLEDLSRQVLRAGYIVVVDATFIKHSERKRFRQLAHSLAVPFRIIHCETDIEILRRRIRARQAEGRDASEAGLSVLELQRENQQPLGEDERDETFHVDTTGDVDLSAIKAWLQSL
ncbi:MAG: AAA family ATPase [Gammaproteobacteria bacterium]|nr:AAA family ATPase [Gammaproteobacteria bacterium]MCF6361776.1 AAA family ATPase [Gammaproteobacteria bacterium]